MPRPRKKVKFTWAELRVQRGALERFERYLPTLKLKQQQLQLEIFKAHRQYRIVLEAVEEAQRQISRYRPVLNDTAGVNLEDLSAPERVKSATVNVAGVRVPVFESADFPRAAYSLFGTPPWVDRALADLRGLKRRLAELEIVGRKRDLLEAELKKVLQRVNLFEKIIIPQTRENIRRIRVALGDQMTAAVARAKLAKEKLAQSERRYPQERSPT